MFRIYSFAICLLTIFGSEGEINQEVEGKASEKTINVKAYEVWDRNVPFPCVSENRPYTEGIFYIKVPKTASSTLARITTRFSAREAKRQGFDYGVFCKTYNPMKHSSASSLKVADRDKSKSFLWTVLREPNNRAISHYGMRLTFGKVKSTDGNFISDLKKNNAFRSNTQLEFVAPSMNENLVDTIQNVLEEYNFIGVYERLDESLVVLSMIMGMDINDVLNSYRPSTNTRCGSLVENPKWLTQGMSEYLESDEWKEKQSGDFMLYRAANEALDATIQILGPEQVKKNLAQFRRLVRIGTDLSRDLRKENGCGVIFATPYSDIDELKNFASLRLRDQNFVHSMKHDSE